MRPGRTTPVTVEEKERFLAALVLTPNVAHAAQAAGFARQTAYKIRKHDPDFAAEWDNVYETHLDAYEDEVRRRAFEGWDEPVYQGGEEVGVVRRWSDKLAMFYLQAKRAEFRPHRHLDVQVSERRLVITAGEGGLIPPAGRVIEGELE